MRRLEVLADAIMRYNGYVEGSGTAYDNRNPGLLRSFSPRQLCDENGYRLFSSFIDGYQALLYDLFIKLEGKSNSKLKPDDNLKALMRVYGYPESMARFVAKFVNRALDEQLVDEELTPLSFFVES